MFDAEETNHKWFDRLQPKISESLGESYRDADCELSVPSGSFFVSNVYYANFRPKCANEDERDKKSISIVVKRPMQNELARQMMQSDRQFHNEILFYQRYAEPGGNFPRSIYLEENPPSDSVIALENVGRLGFEICPRKYDVPLKYTLAAMREIGRFHGHGYVMKERRSDEFFDIIGQIQDTRFADDISSTFGEYINLIASRAIEYLRNQNYDRAFCDTMEKYLDQAFENIMMKAIEPYEPLATMCHGDFTINNILFKEENEKVKCMLIDFALLRYGSPALDLSTFICLSCPKQLKKPEFEVLLKAYHESLTEYLAENDIVDNEKFTYEAFYNDHKERGLFGFVIASFFLAMSMGLSVGSPEEVLKLGVKEAAALNRKCGGDEVSKILADTLLDLKELGCLDHIL